MRRDWAPHCRISTQSMYLGRSALTEEAALSCSVLHMVAAVSDVWQ